MSKYSRSVPEVYVNYTILRIIDTWHWTPLRGVSVARVTDKLRGIYIQIQSLR